MRRKVGDDAGPSPGRQTGPDKGLPEGGRAKDQQPGEGCAGPGLFRSCQVAWVDPASCRRTTSEVAGSGKFGWSGS